MKSVGFELTGLSLALMAFLMYSANLALFDAERLARLRNQLYGVALLGIVFGLMLFSTILFPEAGLMIFAQVGPRGAMVGIVASLGLGAGAIAILRSAELRQQLRRIFGPGYDPDSPIHLTALVLSGALLSFTISSLIAGGGVAGLADAIHQTGLPMGRVIFQSLIWVLAALLGVGLYLRRSPAQALSRLGLRRPGWGDIAIGLGGGLLLYGVALTGSMIWNLLASPELVAEQSAVSSALAQSVTGWIEVLLLALLAAVSEEIFFRGALQPVFGIAPTALLFAALHVQYGFTPALVVLFLVSLGFGWIAQRRGTLAAITAHFAYNFVQLALVLTAASLLPSGTS